MIYYPWHIKSISQCTDLKKLLCLNTSKVSLILFKTTIAYGILIDFVKGGANMERVCYQCGTVKMYEEEYQELLN